MTREEAKSAKVKYLNSDDEWSNSIIPVLDCHELLDDIYDDFESRTCENCKYYDATTYNVSNDTTGFCKRLAIGRADAYIEFEDFGCNKFTRK